MLIDIGARRRPAGSRRDELAKDRVWRFAMRCSSLIRSLLPDDGRRRKRPVYHGDYHLGQVLVVQNDFFIIDFEGEPARPLAAAPAPRTRRCATSPA